MSDVPRISDGSRVMLQRFNGRRVAPAGTSQAENYWGLIGRTGTVIETRPVPGVEADRVLVRFDEAPSDLGLACHNERQDAEWLDSLWIRRADLCAQ